MFSKIALILAILTGFLSTSAFAQENVNINTNGSVTIDGNNVIISNDGNTPLEVYNAQIPENMNLTIDGSGNYQPPQIELTPAEFNRGPVIFMHQEYNLPVAAIQAAGEIAIPVPAAEEASKSAISAPLSNELPKMEIPQLLPQAAASKIEAASALQSAQQSVVNLQGVQHASSMVYISETEAILQ